MRPHSFRLRLSDREGSSDLFAAHFDDYVAARRLEADEFYAGREVARLSRTCAANTRQAFAGLLWSKPFYYLVSGSAGCIAVYRPDPHRRQVGLEYGNSDWSHLSTGRHLDARQMGVSLVRRLGLRLPRVPWPWSIQSLPRASSISVLREWYMHPNGQIPAYEWAFGDVNPPVHAWAAWRVYKMEQAAAAVSAICFSGTRVSTSCC